MEAEALESILSLSDDLILVIFQRFKDAKLLVLCSAVCKRFTALTREMDTIRLSIDLKNGPRYPSISGLKNRFPRIENLELNLFCKVGNSHSRHPKVIWKAIYGCENSIDLCVGLSTPTEISYNILHEPTNHAAWIRTFLRSILEKVRFYHFHGFCNLEGLSSISISTSEPLDYNQTGKMLITKKEILKSKEIKRNVSFKSPAKKVVFWVEGVEEHKTVLFVIKPADKLINIEEDIDLIKKNFNDAEEDKSFYKTVIALKKDKESKKFTYEIPPSFYGSLDMHPIHVVRDDTAF